MVSPDLWTTSRHKQGASRQMQSGRISAHSAARCVDSFPVFQQLRFSGRYQLGMNLEFTGQLANRLAAFERF